MNNEVSNSQILNAITGISNRMDSMEKNLAAMVDTKISEFAEVVNKNIQEKIKCSEDIVNNKMSELEKEMSERRLDDCAEIATKVEGVIVAKLLSSNNVATESRLDQLERQARTNELVISGVPFVENENLEDILNDICKAIKFSGDANSIETYFRLPLGNVIKATANNRRRTPSIIIRFWGADAKIEFFKRYLNTKNLSTNMISGLSASARIYVNENLTRKNFGIFRLARQLKSDGKIFRFNSHNGRIFVKVQADSRLIGIDSQDHLNSLISSNAVGNE